MTAPLRAWTYARVSTTDQAVEGTSLDTQAQQTSDFVKAKGWTLVEHIVDEGISGATDTRPGLDQIMGACRDGSVDVVVVTKLDRFSRSMRHLTNALGELDDLGIAFVSVAESIDSSTSTGRMLRSLLGTFAEFERERIVERMMEGHRRVVSEGFWRGGPAPYGYKLIEDPGGTKHTKVVINEDEAALLRRIADLIVNQGHTTYSVTMLLNIEKITNRSGGLWRHSNIRWHLRQAHLTGRWGYQHQGEWVPMSIPTIFNDDEWGAIQDAIKGRPRPQRRSRLYPLTGRGRCHLRCDCGGNYGGKHDASKGISWYVCGRNAQEFGPERCPHQPRSFRTGEVEQATISALIPVFDSDYLNGLAATYLSQVGDSGGDGDEERRRKIARRLDGLHDEKTVITREQAKTGTLRFLHDAVAEIEQEEVVLREQLHDLDSLSQLRVERDSLDDQLAVLAEKAKAKLSNLTTEEMAEFFDLIELDLERVGDHRFEGTASIPIPPEGGEVWAEGPRDLSPRPR